MSKLDLIIGCMFSGKSSELIRRVNRQRVLPSNNILVINSRKDNRNSSNIVNTHDNVSIDCIKTDNLNHIPIDEYNIIAIDESQFFTGLKQFVKKCLDDDKHVIVAGLDGDFKQEIFGEILHLIPLADTITKLHALCKQCGDGTLASFSKRIIKSDVQELVGAGEIYIPVCRKHLVNN